MLNRCPSILTRLPADEAAANPVRLPTLLCLLLLLSPATGRCEEFSYRFVEFHYMTSDPDSLTEDGHGYELKGAWDFFGEQVLPLVLSGELSVFETDEFAIDGARGHEHVRAGNVSIGSHLPVAESMDAVFGVGTTYRSIDGRDGLRSQSGDALGYTAAAGLRLEVIPRLELAVVYEMSRLDGDDGGSFEAELEYDFTPHLSASAGVEHSSGADGVSAGIDYHF